jgi:hypothetical protein
MRERIKCPECGLIQWNEGYCKRCKAEFEEAHEIFVPPPPEGASPADTPSEASPILSGPPTLGSLPGMLPPTSESSAAGGPGFGVITPEIVVSLEESSRWVRFCSFLGILSGILYIVAGFLIAFLLRGTEGAGPRGIDPFFGFVYMLGGVYNWYAFAKLRAAGKAVTELRTDGEFALLRIVDDHGDFWRLMGILAAAMLGFVVLTVLYILTLT